MLATSMAGPKTSSRTSRLLIVFACAGAIAGGGWYAHNAGWSLEDQDVSDEDDEPVDLKPDSGAPARRTKKKAAPRPKKKANEARQAQGGVVHHGGAPAPLGPSGVSYETAIANNNFKLAPGTIEPPDLTDAELGGPIRDGTFLDACGVPASTHVTVKVAIRNGRAVGVSVYPVPPNREIGWCIERHVRGVQWPANAKMDSFVTTY